jgi:hypothetical protein
VELESLSGKLEISIWVVLKTIKKMETESILGMMAENIRGNGKIMSKTEKECTHGPIKMCMMEVL